MKYRVLSRVYIQADTIQNYLYFVRPNRRNSTKLCKGTNDDMGKKSSEKQLVQNTGERTILNFLEFLHKSLL